MTRTTHTIIALACTLAGCASARDSDTVELRGKVDTHMADTVRAGIASGHRDFTINSSNGGFVFAAMNISKAIRDARGSLTVNGKCYSACSMIAVETHATLTAEADVQSHSSYVPGGPETDDVARVLVAHGLPESLGHGPNLRRITPSALGGMR